MTRKLTLLLCMLALTTAAAGAAQSTNGSNRAAATSGPVNLNTATVAQLEALPGIGKATAERIVDYRQKHGGFKKIEDLMNVRGIGEKSFLQLKELITVSTPRSERE